MTAFQDSIAAALGVVKPEPIYREGWIIMGCDTEYNDEYCYFTDGYRIESPVYLDEEEAVQVCAQKNVEWRETQDADDWNEPLADIEYYVVQPVKVQV